MEREGIVLLSAGETALLLLTMTKSLLAILLLLPLIALGDDSEPCINCYCDVVYYCETTKLIDVKFDGSTTTFL